MPALPHARLAAPCPRAAALLTPLALLALAACAGSGSDPGDTDPAGGVDPVFGATDRPGPTDDGGEDTDAATDSPTDTDTDTVGATDPPTDTDPGGSTDTDTDTDATGPWDRGLTLDGDAADWPASATFQTSSGSTAVLTWSSTDLFVGHERADVATGGPQHWLVVLVGATGAAGATAGPDLNTQAPGLPGPATLALRWKADDTYRDVLAGSAQGWAADPATDALCAVAESNANEVVEVRIPRSALPSGDLWVASYWVFEGAGSESTFAALPATALADGYDPDLSKVLRVDLGAASGPAAATAWP